MMKSLKAGFTLAEVLTTLMVIGVVAAMTIPTLMNSTGEQQARVATKKAASVLSQATQLLTAREVECNISTEATAAPIQLAACMNNVIAGSVIDNTLTTADGMIYTFYAAPTTGGNLDVACGATFADWNGKGNCAVYVDTNGLSKGTKVAAPASSTFTADGGLVYPQAAKDGNTDIAVFSLSAAGARPIAVVGGTNANKTYEYMYGKTPAASDVAPVKICVAGADASVYTVCQSDNKKATTSATWYTTSGDCATGYVQASGISSIVQGCN